MPKKTSPSQASRADTAQIGDAGSASSALAIAAQQLGPEQQLFNKLLDQIEKQSKELNHLKTLVDAHASERAAKLAPLRQQVRALQEQLVLYLDQRLQSPKGLSQRVCADMRELVFMLLDDLLGAGEPSPALRAVASRFGADDDGMEDGLDAETSAELNRAMAQAMGVPVDEEELLSTEEMMEALMRKMQAEDEAAIQAHAARQAKRKKSAKQKQAEQEQLDAHSALRSIYRKLASALHPDRETDPAERLRKTRLMVRVNAANESKDLLALLHLQMEVDQINPASVAALADDKLRAFNRMLKSQLKDLQAEYQSVLGHVQMVFEVGYGAVSQKHLDGSLRLATQRLQTMVDYLQRDVVTVQNDKMLKKWLKHQLSLIDMAYNT